MLLHVSEVPFFLRPNNIPLYLYSTYTHCIHILFFWSTVDAHLGCSYLWLLWITLLWILMLSPYLSLWCQFFGVYTRSRIAKSYANSNFNFLRNHQAGSPGGCSILYPQQVPPFNAFKSTNLHHFPRFWSDGGRLPSLLSIHFPDVTLKS